MKQYQRNDEEGPLHWVRDLHIALDSLEAHSQIDFQGDVDS
jgi:hypothetical protein